MKRYENRKYVDITEEEIQQIKAEQDAYKQTSEYKLSKIAELKQKLTDTDYNIIKIVEGSATLSEMANIIKQRKMWRAEINELEKQL